MRLKIAIDSGTNAPEAPDRYVAYEEEICWNALGTDYVRAMAAFMFAVGFHPETIIESMEEYVESQRSALQE